jgi:predicted acylesterase/phospholipase RssA
LNGLNPYDTTDKYSISLALSGGGARGLATIGILRAFEEKDIEIKAIAGTSMGGIIGGLYAAGYTPDSLKAIVKEINFDRLFSNSPSRKSMFLTQRRERDRHLISVRFNSFVPVIPKALTAGQKLTNVLTDLTTRVTYLSAGNFDLFPIPFRTVCTDVLTGQEVVLSSGSLSEAMRSTMAFPLAFTGIEKDGKLLMDGGMLTPVPVALVKTMAKRSTFTVAVNSTSPLVSLDELVTPVDIANQVTSIMTADKLKKQLKLADYVIKPINDNALSADFKQSDSLIQLGYMAGLSAADSIITLIKQREETARYLIRSISVSPELQQFQEQFSDHLINHQFSYRSLSNKIKSLVKEFELFELNVTVNLPARATADTLTQAASSVELVLTGFPCLNFSELTFRFVGNTIFDDLELARQLEINNRYLAADDLKHGLDRILNLYFIKKHNMADISEVEINYDLNLITITIDEAIIRFKS